jgi:hypothetical protein
MNKLKGIEDFDYKKSEKYIKTFEGWFSKKIVDESAKESCRKSIKEFLKRNTYMPLADSMSDEVLIRTIKGFADNREVSKSNELAWQLYQIAKPLF